MLLCDEVMLRRYTRVGFSSSLHITALQPQDSISKSELVLFHSLKERF